MLKPNIVVGIALALSAPAFADTIKQDFTANNLSFFGPNLDLFDPSLGTLEQVIIEGKATYAPVFYYAATLPIFGVGQPGQPYSITISTDFSGTPYFVKQLPTQTQTIVSSVTLPDPGIFTIVPKFKISFDETYTSASDLASFYGAGTAKAGVALNNAKNSTTVVSSSNVISFPGPAGIFLDTSIAGSVTYVFSKSVAASVPEPTSWALFISGFGMVGTALHRKRAAVNFV